MAVLAAAASCSASASMALPVLLAFTLAAVQAVDPRYAETALALRRLALAQVMARVLHEARFGVMAAVLSAASAA